MRLFVGVELDEEVRAAAAGVAERLRKRFERSRVHVTARWVEPENLHLTLWFIGEVTDDRAAGVTTVVESPFDTPPFALSVRGCGAFPRSGPPRVFWLGVADGLVPMSHIHEELERRLVPIGFEAEKRPYLPHVTMARVKEIRGDARRAREALAAVPADCGACRIQAVTLFRSRPSPKGSRYEPLLRVPLA